MDWILRLRCGEVAFWRTCHRVIPATEPQELFPRLETRWRDYLTSSNWTGGKLIVSQGFSQRSRPPTCVDKKFSQLRTDTCCSQMTLHLIWVFTVTSHTVGSRISVLIWKCSLGISKASRKSTVSDVFIKKHNWFQHSSWRAQGQKAQWMTDYH